MTAVVRIFVRHRSAVFCRQRDGDARSAPGPLDVPHGELRPDSEDPTDVAWRVLRGETTAEGFTLLRSGEPLAISDDGTDQTVFPFLFEAIGHDDPLHDPADEGEWVVPTALLDRDTAPGLWQSYRRVAPDVETVRADDTHGATWLSLRALEVVRDTAGEIAFGTAAGGIERVRTTARELRTARPSMVVIQNRIDRTMSSAPATPHAVHDRAVDTIDAALDVDLRAAETAANAITDISGPVVTLSRSGTVAETLRRTGRSVLVGESRPAREGVTTAEELAAAGLDVTLTTDAALPGRLREGDVSCVLFGADRILSSSDVVNKVGSYPLAVAALANDVPVVVVATTDKITDADEPVSESGTSADVYDGECAVTVSNPIFERIPADLIHGIATEDGLLDAPTIARLAGKHRSMSAWTAISDVDNARE